MTFFAQFKLALGRCPRCFRQSFAAAAVALGAVFALRFAWPDSSAYLWVAPVAAGAVALWLTHMALFTARVTRSAIEPEPLAPAIGRRAALRAFAYGAGIGVLLSVVRPNQALAQVGVPGCLQNALCNASRPCGGCPCRYPQGATVGYCSH